jgi:hypothetical protein
MLRIATCLVAAMLVAGSLHSASAQTGGDAKPSKTRLTMEKLKEMKARWSANRPKLKVCRAEVRRKGLTGDARWFYMEDCMEKS